MLLIGNVTNGWTKSWFVLPALRRRNQQSCFQKTLSCNTPAKLNAILFAHHTLVVMRKFYTASSWDGALSAAVGIQKSTSTISIRCKAWCTMHTISWQFFHVICPRCWWTTFPTLSFYSILKYLLFNPTVSSDNMSKISVLSLHDPRSEVQICSHPFKYPGVSSFVFPYCLQKTSVTPHLESINPLPVILSHSPWLTSIGGNRESNSI